MKKVVIPAIAVLFLLVSFEYASAQQPNLGGTLPGLALNVTYQQEVLPKDLTKQSESDKFVTVFPPIRKSTYDPILYIAVNPSNGNFLEIDFYWKNPKSGSKILTISCPSPAIISSEPMISITKPPATVTDSFRGFAVCTFCPDGINTSNVPPTCNSGEATGSGALYFDGAVRRDTATEIPTSVSIGATVYCAGFNYLGKDDWATPNCTLYPDFPACPAILIGSFGAVLKPCPEIDPLGDPECTNL